MHKEIVDSLKKAGLNFFVTLPDSRIHEMIEIADKDTEIKHVPVAREEEGIGICAGAYLGGKKPVFLMQNAGLLNSCNGLVTLNMLYEIPVLLFISYRGDFGEESFFHVPLGRVTIPMLDAMGIPYRVLRNKEDLSYIAEAQELIESSKKPVALLLEKKMLQGKGD